MPLAAQDLAEDLIFALLDGSDRITGIQKDVLSRLTWFQGGSSSRLQTVNYQISKELAGLEAEARNYYAYTLPKIYLEGMKVGLGNTAYRLTEADMNVIKEIQRRGLQDLADAQARTISDTRRFLTMVRQGKDPEVSPGKSRSNQLYILSGTKAEGADAESILKNHGIKGVRYADGKKYTLGDYGSMSVRSNANSTYNLGILGGARAAKIEVVEVQDGPECGWTRHDDHEHADGTIRTIDAAMEFPTAHPNCKRTFLPRPDLKKEDAEKKRGLSGKEKALIFSGAVGAGVAAAAVISQTELVSNVERRIAAAAMRGDPLSQFFITSINTTKNLFLTESQLGQVIVGQFPGQVRNVLLGVGDKIGPESPIFRAAVGDIYSAGLRFADGIDDVAVRVREAIGATTNSVRHEMADRFQFFAKFETKLHNGDIDGEQLAKILQFETNRLKLLSFRVMKDTIFDSGVVGRVTEWGPRLRIDITDYIRARITLPVGSERTIKNIATHGLDPFRAALHLSKEGLLGGHLSLVPKGMLRGIVEVDQNGHFVGNVRLVPKGPLKVRMEFGLKGWTSKAVGSLESAANVRQEIETLLENRSGRMIDALANLSAAKDMARLQPGVAKWAEQLKVAEQDYTRAKALVRDARDKLALFERFKFNIEDPHLSDLWGDLKYMQLNRVVLDYKVFKMGPAEIAGRLSIPIDDVRKALGAAENAGLKLVVDGERTLVSGVIHISAPQKIIDGIVQYAQEHGSLIGNIRFGQFVNLHGNYKYVKDATGEYVATLATNFRVRGYNVFQIANALELRAEDVIAMTKDKISGFQNLMIRMGVKDIRDIGPAFDGLLDQARQSIPMMASYNRQEMVQATIDSLTGERMNENRRELLRIMAGIGEKDGPSLAEQKLWELRSYLSVDQIDRAAELVDFPDALKTVDMLNNLTRQSVQSVAERLTTGWLSKPVEDPISLIGESWAKLLEDGQKLGYTSKLMLERMQEAANSVLLDSVGWVLDPIGSLRNLTAQMADSLIARLETGIDRFFGHLFTGKTGVELTNELLFQRVLAHEEQYAYGKDFIFIEDKPGNQHAIYESQQAINDFRKLFPNAPTLRITMHEFTATEADISVESTWAYYDYTTQMIHLNQKVFGDDIWVPAEAMAKDLHNEGWWTSYRPRDTIFHEIGHHMDYSTETLSQIRPMISPDGLQYYGASRSLSAQIFLRFAADQGVSLSMADVLAEEADVGVSMFGPEGFFPQVDDLFTAMETKISTYATTNPAEFLAEMFTKLMQERVSGQRISGVTTYMGEQYLKLFGG